MVFYLTAEAEVIDLISAGHHERSAYAGLAVNQSLILQLDSFNVCAVDTTALKGFKLLFLDSII